MESTRIKLFEKYEYEGVVIKDITLAPILNVTRPGIVPHTNDKKSLGRFRKSNTSIIERFAVHLMQHGRNSGKKRLAIKLLKQACEIMHKATKENPIQLLVDACLNAGPKENSARIGKGASSKRASVDVSPTRRLNIALRLLGEGIRVTAFKNSKSMPEVIANEIMAAAKNAQSSYAVKKREEIERVAKSNR